MEEWDQNKLLSLIKEKVEENLHLDYKNAQAIHDSKKKEIAKDVSAFANSDGGVLIYGIAEYDERDKAHLPKEITPINRIDYSKEWLEQVINSGINPKIHGVIITPVNLDSGENDVVYVVNVPKGSTAHQASVEKRYYKRYNFQSIAMDDWEIKDVINRVQQTKVTITLRPKEKKETLESILNMVGIKKNLEFDVVARNEGNKVIKYLDCFFYLSQEQASSVVSPKPSKYKDHSQIGFSNVDTRSFIIEGKEVTLSKDRFVILPKTWRVIGKLIIEPKLAKESPSIKISVSTEDNHEKIDFHLGLPRNL